MAKMDYEKMVDFLVKFDKPSNRIIYDKSFTTWPMSSFRPVLSDFTVRIAKTLSECIDQDSKFLN